MGRNSTVGKGAEAGAGATPPLGTGRAGRDGAPVVPDPGRLRLRPPRRPPAGQPRPVGDAGAPTDLPAPAGRVAYGPAQPRSPGRRRRALPHGHSELLAGTLRLLRPARPAAHQQRPGALLRVGAAAGAPAPPDAKAPLRRWSCG